MKTITKATNICLTGSGKGTWIAMCTPHAKKYAPYYPKAVEIDYDEVQAETFGTPDCEACWISADLAERHRGGYIDAKAVARINRDRGGHFFDAATMKSFCSYTPDAGRFLPGDHLSIAIITSEKRRGFMAPDGPRTYTVRILDCVTGYLEEDPQGFGGYSTLKAARKGLERVLVAGRVQVAA